MSVGRQPRTSHRRPFRPAVLVLALVCSLASAACGNADPRQASPVAAPTSTSTDATDVALVESPVGRPRTVAIPAIDVAADVVEVGLKPDGAMDVPDFGVAGWYGPGPAPPVLR